MLYSIVEDSAEQEVLSWCLKHLGVGTTHAWQCFPAERSMPVAISIGDRSISDLCVSVQHYNTVSFNSGMQPAPHRGLHYTL